MASAVVYMQTFKAIEMPAMSNASTNWDVRTPLVYGSRSVAICPSEQDARAYAEEYGKAKVEGFAGLQIHTKTRTVYIVQDDVNE